MKFEEDEYIMMAMFQKENRRQTMDEIRGILPFAKEDEEILSLADSTREKMERMSDREFSALDLEPYQQEPEDE